MKKILYIGPSPLGIGGISIHIRRLSNLMNKDFIIDYVDEGRIRYKGIFNLRSGNVFKYLVKVVNSDIIHINSGIWSLRAIHIFICRLIFRKKVLVTIHRDPNIEPHKFLTKWLIKWCNYGILVNREGYKAMYTEGPCKYVLLPAFLPPNMDEEPLLPESITQWVTTLRKVENSYLMISNASNLVVHNNFDLYGLDICLEALTKLKKDNTKNYYLLFIVASNTEQQERMNSYKKIIVENGLEENVMIWEASASFVRMIQLCDLVLRTTNTDGDAISIRESLYFGKPVLASDVVQRPRGVCLFKTRDANDLAKKIKDIANHGNQFEVTESMDYHELYFNMYN